MTFSIIFLIFATDSFRNSLSLSLGFFCLCSGFDLKCFVRVSLSIAICTYAYTFTYTHSFLQYMPRVSVSVSANTYVSYTCSLPFYSFRLPSVFVYFILSVFFSFAVLLFYFIFWHFRYILSEFYCVLGSLFPPKCVCTCTQSFICSHIVQRIQRFRLTLISDT